MDPETVRAGCPDVEVAGMRQRWSILLSVSLWLLATAAQAVSFDLDMIPAGPVNSGNGQLQFSNFQFFSPFNTVDAGDITLTTLDDGIEISGPVGVTGTGVKTFFVLYEVTALGPGIDSASLLLDSQVSADHFGLVLATKKILGEQLHSPELPNWWEPGGKKGHGHEDLFPLLGRSLAHLKTADWDVDRESCKHAPFGACDAAIRLVEAGFDPQSSIRVIDRVTLSALDGTAIWESSVNRFTVVPEPGVASLTLLGLVILSLRRRSS
jgi:hypothetical protein